MSARHPSHFCRPLRSRAGGFTLVEVVIALSLFAALMVLVFGAMRFANTAVEKGETRAELASDVRLIQSFLRRELSQAFPQRFREKTGPQAKIAFEGESQKMFWVAPRPAKLNTGGMAAVSIEVVDEGNFERRNKKLVMRRTLLKSDANDFEALADAEVKPLMENLDSMEFNYFGSEKDTDEATWRDTWEQAQRFPRMVRVRGKRVDGYVLPDLVIALQLGEEAGCLNTTFQRICPPQRLRP